MRLNVLTLALALAAGAAPSVVLAQAAAPAAAASATAPTIRPEIAPPLQAAQKALGEKQFAAALQALQQAEAVEGRTAYETYLIERMRFLAHSGLGDEAGKFRALEAAFATGQVEAELQATLMDQASSAAYALKDYDRAAFWARRAIEAGADADLTRLRLSQSLYLREQYPQAAQVMAELAVRQRAAGRKPGEPQLRLQAANLLKMGDEAGYTRTLEELLAVSPKPDFWADRLARLLRQPGFDEAALALDLFRLSRRVGAFPTAQADVQYATLALGAGFPAEALRVLEAGYAAGRLGQGADAARHAELRERARKAAEGDRAGGAPDGAALLARDATLAFTTGWALYSDGKAEAGIGLMRQALARGMARPDRGQLRLGTALAASGGDLAEARRLLASARDAGAGDGCADLARLTLIALDAPR